MTTAPFPAPAPAPSTPRRAPRWRRLAAALAALALAGAGLAGAGAIVDEEGVLYVGTKEDGATTGSRGDASHDGGSGPASDDCPKDEGSTCPSEEERCIIDIFGFCFPFQEDWYEEGDSVDRGSNYSYAYAEDNRTGYEADVLDGTLRAGSAAGSRNSTTGEGHDAAYRDYHRDTYSNSFGWSEDHATDRTYSSQADSARSQGMDDTSTGAAASLAAAGRTLGGADIALARERDAYETSSHHERSDGANHTHDTFLGIPVWEKNDAQSYSADEETTRHWNRTGAAGTVFLIEPIGNATIRIVGLSLERGDEHEEGDLSSGSSSSDETKIVGIGAREEQEASSETTYSTYHEWTNLVVDLANGLVVGSITYDRGTSESERATSGADRQEYVGLLFGNASHETNDTSRTWRDARVALDAAHGLGVVDVRAWDDDETYHRESESEIILAGLGFGSTETDDAATHTDGLAATFLLQNGSLLRLTISYVNTSESYSNSTDWNVGGGSFGYGEEHHETTRRVGVDAGSTEGSGGSVYREEGTTNDAIKARQDGEDVAEIRDETTYTKYGAGGAAPSGLVSFQLTYTEGTSKKTIAAFGTPLFESDGREQRLDAAVGGDVRHEATGHLLTYEVRHVETSSARDYSLGGSEVGRIYRNDTTDGASVNALDGQVRASATRNFWTEQIQDSGGSEIVDRSVNSVDVSLRAETGVTPVIGEYHAAVGYIDFADTVALGGVLATWCTIPALPLDVLPWQDVLGLLPTELAAVGAIAGFAIVLIQLGVLVATCFFAVAPFILILNPCLVADIAVPLALALAGLFGESAPEPVGFAFATALGGVDAAYAIGRDAWDDTFSCTFAPVPDDFITIPREARNWQPVLEGLDPVTDVVDPAVATLPPAADDARGQAWDVVDMADADRAVPNPEGIPLPPAVAAPRAPRARRVGTRAHPLQPYPSRNPREEPE